MRYTRYLVVLILGLLTSFFTWNYIHRVQLDYDTEGKFFSSEDGVVYYEQAKEIYGILAFLGLIFTGIILYKLIRNK